MRGAILFLAFTVLTPALFLACESDEETTAEPNPAIDLLNQTAIAGSTLVLLDKEADRAFLLDLSADEPADGMTVVDLSPNPFMVVTRNGKAKEALVLSSGRRGVSQPTVLSALRANGKLREYEVGAPFDSLEQSEDGRYAVLYFGQGSQELLLSLNQIAIVDLDADVDGENTIVKRSIDTPGGPPSKLEVSPPLMVGEGKKTVAVLLSESYATLVDLKDVKRAETVIRLSSAEGEEAAQPEQMVFAPELGQIYLRGANSDDVFAITLNPDDDDFETTVDQITAGTQPSDLAVYGEGASTRLLIVSESDRQAHVADISVASDDSADSRDEGSSPPPIAHVDLDDAADSLLIFETEESDSDDANRVHALLYAHGGRALTFLDLREVETLAEKNLQTIRSGSPIARIEQLPDQNLALIVHDGSRLEVLDLEERKILTAIDVNGSLSDAIYSSSLPRLWVAPPDQHFAGCVNLLTGDTTEILLDRKVSRFVVMPEPELAVAIHKVPGDEEEGTVDSIAVTVLDAIAPKRDEAIFFDGFLEY